MQFNATTDAAKTPSRAISIFVKGYRHLLEMLPAIRPNATVIYTECCRHQSDMLPASGPVTAASGNYENPINNQTRTKIKTSPIKTKPI